VKEPAKVKVEKGVISALTAQDAINTAVNENKVTLKTNQGPEVGAVMVKFPSASGSSPAGSPCTALWKTRWPPGSPNGKRM